LVAGNDTGVSLGFNDDLCRVGAGVCIGTVGLCVGAVVLGAGVGTTELVVDPVGPCTCIGADGPRTGTDVGDVILLSGIGFSPSTRPVFSRTGTHTADPASLASRVTCVTYSLVFPGTFSCLTLKQVTVTGRLNSIPIHTLFCAADPLQWVSFKSSNAFDGSEPAKNDTAVGVPCDVSTFELGEQSEEEYSSIHWTDHRPAAPTVAEYGADSRQAFAVFNEGVS
jgi:hypothetical protein